MTWFETTREVPLDETGDDGRIVKMRHLHLYEITSGLFFRKHRWKAIYRLNPAIVSSDHYWASARPQWALADCIGKVLGSGWIPYESPNGATAP